VQRIDGLHPAGAVHVGAVAIRREREHVVVERPIGVVVGPLEPVEGGRDEGLSRVLLGGFLPALVDGRVAGEVGDLVVGGDPVGDIGAVAQRLG
jgi:hypothetical protein